MEINKVLKDNNFEFKKKFGQNFITDTNLLEAICDDAELSETDEVWYTITGIRIDKPLKRGIYINNGKKTVVK